MFPVKNKISSVTIAIGIREKNLPGAVLVVANKLDTEATQRRVSLYEAKKMFSQRGVTSVLECTWLESNYLC